MTVTTTNETTNSIVLQMSPVISMDEDSLFDFCQLNSHLRIERTSTGELIIMSPAGSETGNRNFKLIQQLANWTDKDGTVTLTDRPPPDAHHAGILRRANP